VTNGHPPQQELWFLPLVNQLEGALVDFNRFGIAIQQGMAVCPAGIKPCKFKNVVCQYQVVIGAFKKDQGSGWLTDKNVITALPPQTDAQQEGILAFLTSLDQCIGTVLNFPVVRIKISHPVPFSVQAVNILIRDLYSQLFQQGFRPVEGMECRLPGINLAGMNSTGKPAGKCSLQIPPGFIMIRQHTCLGIIRTS